MPPSDSRIAAGSAVAIAISAGSGPRLLHARTYRWEGHTSTDLAAYRTAEELAAGKSRDPLAKLGAALADAGFNRSEITRIDEAAAAEMEEARDRARAAPPPDADSAFEDVQDAGAPVRRAVA